MQQSRRTEWGSNQDVFVPFTIPEKEMLLATPTNVIGVSGVLCSLLFKTEYGPGSNPKPITRFCTWRHLLAQNLP